MCAIPPEPWTKVVHLKKREEGKRRVNLPQISTQTTLESQTGSIFFWFFQGNLPPQLKLPFLSYQELGRVWDLTYSKFI